MFGHEKSSAGSQTLKVLNEICEGTYYDYEDDLATEAHEKPLPKTPSSKHGVDDPGVPQMTLPCFDGIFETPIRQHGIPLDTITEKNSISTMPSRMPTRNEDREAIDRRRELSRNSFAPAISVKVDSSISDSRDRLFHSLDDKMLLEYRRRAELHIVSEVSDIRSSAELANAKTPELEPLERIKTPEGLPRWPGDPPRHSPTPRGGRRRTSAYVRGIYRRLVGSPLDGHEDDAATSVSTASRIPVPSRLARGRRTGPAYWRPLPSGHGVAESRLAHVPDIKTVQGGDGGSARANVALQENVSPARRMIKKSLSTVFNASPGQPVADAAIQRRESYAAPTPSLPHAPGVEPSVNATSALTSLTNAQTEGSASNEGVLPAASAKPTSPTKSPVPKCVSSLHGESPAKEVRLGRSTSSARSPLVTLPSSRSRPELNSPTASARAFSYGSPAGSCASSEASSWALPVTPFPCPPSPDIYTTPPMSREDAAINRSTIDGAMIIPSDRSSAHDYDAAMNRQIAEDIRSSASNSSTSLVTGRSAYYPTPNITRFVMTSDPFVNRPELRVTNPTDEDGDIESSTYTPSIPVKIPSPLRPRRRNPQLSLFPDTQSPEARLPPFPPGMPIVRALRSVSSLMRGKTTPKSATSQQQQQQRLQHVKTKRSALSRPAVYGGDVKRCRHGRIVTPKPGNRVGDWRWRLRYRLREARSSCWRCRMSQLVSWKSSILPKSKRSLHIRTASGDGDTAITRVPHPLEHVERQRSKERSRRERMRKVLVWMPARCYCQVIGDGESAFSGPQARERTALPVRVAERRSVVE